MKLQQIAAGFALAIFVSTQSLSANILTNASFETDNASAGDVGGATGWTTFESVFTNDSTSPGGGPAPSDGTNTLKMFGPFFPGGASGAFQNGFATNAGDVVNASVEVQNWSVDGLTNIGIFQIGFFDSGDNLITAFDNVVDATLTADVWTTLTHDLVAPAGTATTQFFLLHVQVNDPVTGGSIFWDNASLTITSAVPEPTTFGLVGLGLVGLATRRRRS